MKFFLLLLLSLSICNCSEPKINPSNTITINIPNNKLDLGNKTSSTLSFNAVTNWEISLSDTKATPSWIEVTPKSGAAGDVTLNISITAPNETDDTRSAFITINAGGASIKIEITQAITIGLPILTTTQASDITANTFVAGGDISSDGGTEITARGVCWSASQNPTIHDPKSINGLGKGLFVHKITNLSGNTIYYIRAYATNSVGTAYGQQVSATTEKGELTIITNAPTNITPISATSGGEVTTNGQVSIAARGVCWDTAPIPTIANHKTSNGTGAGSFLSNITGLVPNTIYYIRAYATTTLGVTSYGNELIVTTINTIPVLSTSTATFISNSSAIIGGNITSDGDIPIISRGVCWSTSPNATIDQHKVAHTSASTGSFSCTLIGLTNKTTYYARAYVINVLGPFYAGNEVSFVTRDPVPPIITLGVSNITMNSASCGGTITSDINTPVTSRGVCWSTSPNPTIKDNKTSDGSGIGSFTSFLTGLTPNTTYYVKSYAINDKGTHYANDKITFTTKESNLEDFNNNPNEF